MTTPRVSIIMPVYNQAWIVHRAVQSVAWQTFRDFEFILVDDGSTDGLDSPYLAQASGARDFIHCRRPKPGGTAAIPINTGFDLARAPYVTWISGDNLMTPDWLERLVKVLDGGAGAAYGGFWYVPAPRDLIEPMVADSRIDLPRLARSWEGVRGRRYIHQPHVPGKQIQEEACYYGPAFLIRREVWTPHEGGASHDLGHWLRVEELCQKRGWPIVGVDHPLCHYLAHDERCVLRQPELYDSPAQLEAARSRRRGGSQ